MSGPSKKSKKSDKHAIRMEGDMSDDSDKDEDMEEGESEGEELMTPDIINFNFEARNAEEFDYKSIVNFLKMLFLNVKDLDFSGLANEIIARNNVGSVIKQVLDSDADDSEDDDSDDGVAALGLVTVLDLMDSKKPPCYEKVRTLLLDRCIEFEKKSKEVDASVDASVVAGKFARVLSNVEQHLGLIVNERCVNIPAQLALPFFESLWKEVERAKKKDLYNFTHYILIAKTYRAMITSESSEKDSSKKKSSQKKSSKTPVQQRSFVKAEEEIFFENADASFDFSVQTSENDFGFGEQWNGEDTPLEPTRTVVLISTSKLPVIMARMKELYSQ